MFKKQLQSLVLSLLFSLSIFILPFSPLFSQSNTTPLISGTGYTTPAGSTARFIRKNAPGQPSVSRPINTSFDPWKGLKAQLAGSYIPDLQAFFSRYNITRSEYYDLQFLPQGYSNEDIGVTWDCLRNMCRAGVAGLGPATKYDCEPTAVEAYDFAVRNPAGGGLYITCFQVSREPIPEKPEKPAECPQCPQCPRCPTCPTITCPDLKCPDIVCPNCPECPDCPKCPEPVIATPLSQDAQSTLDWLKSIRGFTRIGPGRQAAIGRLIRELASKGIISTPANPIELGDSGQVDLPITTLEYYPDRPW